MTWSQTYRHIGVASLVMIGAISAATSAESLEEQAARIHRHVLTVDTHVDTPLGMLGGAFDIGQRHDVRQRGGRVDLPRMQDGGLDAAFFAVYLGQGPRTPAGYKQAQQRAVRIFEAIHAAVERNEDLSELALTEDDAYRLKAAGKRAIYIGIENGYALGTDLSLVQRYYDLGARYLTLCHSQNNDLCDSSTDKKPEHQGLSAFGRQVVVELNRLGMIVDVSHVSDRTFYDVLELTRAPVIASHSCARALCDHPRNLDDAMLRALSRNGGVTQVCFVGAYVKRVEPNPRRDAEMKRLRGAYQDYEALSEARKREVHVQWDEINRTYPDSTATVSDVVDHIDHIVKIAGSDHVGIGSDFDGGGGVEGCQDVSQMESITRELVRRGYSADQIRQIWGGNVMRVLREVQRAAADMSQVR